MEVAALLEDPPCLRSHPSHEYPQFTSLIGEHPLLISKTVDGSVMVTNFRFCVCEKKSINIPLMMVGDLLVSEAAKRLRIGCKDGSTYSCTFATTEDCQSCMAILREKTGLPQSSSDLFAYRFYDSAVRKQGLRPNLTSAEEENVSLCQPVNPAFAYSFDKETERLQFDTSKQGPWRKSQANKNYEFCPTYPKFHLLPAAVDDDRLKVSLDFRALKRFPSVVWRDKRTGMVLIRSSQPLSSFLGVSYFTNHADVSLIEEIVNACNRDWHKSRHSLLGAEANKGCDCDGAAGVSSVGDGLKEAVAQESLLWESSSVSRGHSPINGGFDSGDGYIAKKLAIVDCRSLAGVWGNSFKGGGTEDEAIYKCSTVHLDLANIHNVRDSFNKLRILCHAYVEGTFLKSLSSCMWLSYISALLRGANIVVELMHVMKRPVLVHCSDGWDRTSQIVSLSELMMDSYYRTLEGFQVLVEREWLHFGHKFGERGGHDPNCSDTNQISPIFLQFLDCVHQLTVQYPAKFQFNEAYLVKLLQHSYACLFGNFLHNCQKERDGCQQKTASVWALLHPENRQFVNALYKPSDQVLKAKFSEPDIVLWKSVYMGSHINQTDFVRESSPAAAGARSKVATSEEAPRSKSLDALSKVIISSGHQNIIQVDAVASAASAAADLSTHHVCNKSSSTELLHAHGEAPQAHGRTSPSGAPEENFPDSSGRMSPGVSASTEHGPNQVLPTSHNGDSPLEAALTEGITKSSIPATLADTPGEAPPGSAEQQICLNHHGDVPLSESGVAENRDAFLAVHRVDQSLVTSSECGQETEVCGRCDARAPCGYQTGCCDVQTLCCDQHLASTDNVIDKTGIVEAGLVNPDNVQAGLVNTDHSDAGLANPDNSEAGLANPDNSEAVSVNPDYFEAGLVNTDNFQAGLVNPDNFQAGLVNTDNSEAGLANPDNSEAVSVNPDYFETGLVNTDNFQAGLVNPDNFQAALVNTDNSESGLANLDNSEAGLANPDNSEAGLVNTDNFQAGLVNPDNFQAGLVNTDNFQAGLVNLDNFQAGLVNTDNSETGLVNPDNFHTGLVNTDNYEAGLVNPDNFQAGLVTTDNSEAGLVNPYNSEAGLANPDNFDTGNVNSNIDNPGSVEIGKINSNTDSIDAGDTDSSTDKWDSANADVTGSNIDNIGSRTAVTTNSNEGSHEVGNVPDSSDAGNTNSNFHDTDKFEVEETENASGEDDSPGSSAIMNSNTECTDGGEAENTNRNTENLERLEASNVNSDIDNLDHFEAEISNVDSADSFEGGNADIDNPDSFEADSTNSNIDHADSLEAGNANIDNPNCFEAGNTDIDNPNTFEAGNTDIDNPGSIEAVNSDNDIPDCFEAGNTDIDNPDSFEAGNADIDNPDSFEAGNADIDNPDSFEAGNTDIDNPNCFEAVNSDIDNPDCFEAVNTDIDNPDSFEAGNADIYNPDSYEAENADIYNPDSFEAGNTNIDSPGSFEAGTTNVDNPDTFEAGNTNVDRPDSCEAGNTNRDIASFDRSEVLTINIASHESFQAETLSSSSMDMMSFQRGQVKGGHVVSNSSAFSAISVLDLSQHISVNGSATSGYVSEKASLSSDTSSLSGETDEALNDVFENASTAGKNFLMKHNKCESGPIRHDCCEDSQMSHDCCENSEMRNNSRENSQIIHNCCENSQMRHNNCDNSRCFVKSSDINNSASVEDIIPRKDSQRPTVNSTNFWGCCNGVNNEIRGGMVKTNNYNSDPFLFNSLESVEISNLSRSRTCAGCSVLVDALIDEAEVRISMSSSTSCCTKPLEVATRHERLTSAIPHAFSSPVLALHVSPKKRDSHPSEMNEGCYESKMLSRLSGTAVGASQVLSVSPACLCRRAGAGLQHRPSGSEVVSRRLLRATVATSTTDISDSSIGQPPASLLTTTAVKHQPRLKKHIDVDGLTLFCDERQDLVAELLYEKDCKIQDLQRHLNHAQKQIVMLRRYSCQHLQGSLCDHCTADSNGGEWSSLGPVSDSASDASWETVDESVSRMLPWVPPDVAMTHCAGCAAQFGVSRWKHHCRLRCLVCFSSCGQFVCTDCSAVLAQVAEFNKPERVCRRCHSQLLQLSPGASSDGRIPTLVADD